MEHKTHSAGKLPEVSKRVISEYLPSSLQKRFSLISLIKLRIHFIYVSFICSVVLLTMFRDVSEVQSAKIFNLPYKVRDSFSGERERDVWMDEEHRGGR